MVNRCRCSVESRRWFYQATFQKPIARQWFAVLCNTQQSCFCAHLTFSCSLGGPLRVSPTYGTMQCIKIHKLFIWRADASSRARTGIPNACRTGRPTPPILSSSKGQRTVAFLTWPSPQHRDTFVYSEIASKFLFCIVADLARHAYFIQRLQDHFRQQSATVNSSDMRAWRARIRATSSPRLAPSSWTLWANMSCTSQTSGWS